MSIHAFAMLDWKPAPMPESNGPVQLAHLPDLGDGGFRAFVRFPAGWSRPAPGHYTMAEEFLVLQGDLSIDDRTWHAGGYAWIAARRVRTGTRSDGGCLAFAWFGGTPRWQHGVPATPATEADRHFSHWRDAPEGVLRAGPGHATCIIEQPASAALAALLPPCELLALDNHGWCADATKYPAGFGAGPLLARYPTAQ
jgi:hypothetical protein